MLPLLYTSETTLTVYVHDTNTIEVLFFVAFFLCEGTLTVYKGDWHCLFVDMKRGRWYKGLRDVSDMGFYPEKKSSSSKKKDASSEDQCNKKPGKHPTLGPVRTKNKC